MKLTKNRIKSFEREQKEYGTKTALYNIIWQIAADLFKDIGILGIRTIKNVKTK